MRTLPIVGTRKNTLYVHIGSTIKNAPTPVAEILVNGTRVIAPTPITTNFYNAGGSFATQELAADVSSFKAISSIEILVSNTLYVDPSTFSNTSIADVVLNGFQMTPNLATYLDGGSRPGGGQADEYSGLLYGVGKIVFEGSAIPAGPFPKDTQDDIDGGSGFNIAVYRAERANYTLQRSVDGALLVTSAATAEGRIRLETSIKSNSLTRTFL
jgi:hypothetical protein